MTKLLLSLALSSTASLLVCSSAALARGNDAAVARGIDAIRARRYDAAIVEFTNLINSHPNNGEYHALRGSAYYDSQSYLNAERDFALAISLGDTRHVVYEQLNNAVSRSEMAPISTAGQTVDSLMKMGTSELKAGNYKKALAAYTILLSKNLPKEVLYVAYAGRAETFLKLGRKGNAKVDAQSLINAGCRVPGAYDLLKRCTALGRFSPAPGRLVATSGYAGRFKIDPHYNKEAAMNNALGGFIDKQLK